MAVNTAEKFFTVLEKSKLLSTEQLADARRAGQGSDDPKTIAKALARKDLITWWQAGRLLAGHSSFFLGKYKLIELLGRGGMGSVFLGRHVTMNRRVALKILPRRIAKDPASLKRFLSEARTIAALDHPNIVQAYSVDNQRDLYYIVMEYVDGWDLKQLVEADGPMDYQTAADYIRQAADGLAHGHGHGIIHCDIKPSNLLLNKQGVVKIVDMGLNRLTGGNENQVGEQQENRVLGSVDYQAPEQALESSDFDHRADIYSLGCTLYFLLTGHPPFPEGTLSERIMKHQKQQPRRITEQRPDAPAGLVKICQKMMAKRAEDRYQSAEELSRVLAAWRVPPSKRAAVLKVADKLDDQPGDGLPVIDVQAGPRDKPPEKKLPSTKPGNADRAKGKVAEKVGLLQTRQRKIIAAAAAVLLAIVLLAAGAMIPLLIFSGSGNGDKEQAQADAAERATDRERSHAKRSTPDEDSLEEDLEGPEELPVEQPEPDQPGPEQPEPGKEPEPEPQSEPEPEPEVKPEPKAEPKPEPERKPEAKPKPKPKPEPEQKPEAKPKPAPKPDQVDPFKKLAKAVALPPVKRPAASGGKATAPVPLGELQLKPGALVQVELCGGENAVRGNRKFDLKPDEIGKSWLVRFEEESKTGGAPQRTDVARILLDGQILKFQWLEGAGKVRAGCLGNCGLNIIVGGKVRWLSLAQPQHAQPLKLNFDRSSVKTSLSGVSLPKADVLRLQITRLEGVVPGAKFEPTDTVEPKGEISIVLAGKDMPKVTLPVSFVAKTRSVAIEVSGTYQVQGYEPQPLKPGMLRGELVRALPMHQQLNMTVARLKDKTQKAAAQKQLDQISEGIDQLNALLAFCENARNKGKIHFRVFAIPDENDDHQIELFTTEPPPGETPAAAEQPDDDLNLGDPDAEEEDDGLNLNEKKKFF